MIEKRTHIILLFAAVFAFFGCQDQAQSQSKSVWVEQGILKTAQGPFFIKGVCYHPVAIGQTKRSFERLSEDLKLMNEAGINTIRVYEPIDSEDVLDQIHQAGISVITSFGYNQQCRYDLRSGSYLEYVTRFKDHPAILFWELGNEYNYHPEWFGGTMDLWYATLAKAIKAIHQKDHGHPVATAHGEVPTEQLLDQLAELDLWGLNVYRWDESHKAIQDFKQISDKAVYFSELGADSYMTAPKLGYQAGVNQKAQADALERMLAEILTPETSSAGVAIFSFTDGWWKAGYPDRQDVGGWAPGSSGVPYDGTANEEYWGLVDINRNTKQAYRVVQSRFKSFNREK